MAAHSCSSFCGPSHPFHACHLQKCDATPLCVGFNTLGQLKGGIFAPAAVPWHEVTIVVRAWIVAGICALASLALLKVR